MPLPVPAASLEAALVVHAYMTVAFLLAVPLRRNDVADVAWGLGFALVAWWGVWMQAPLSSGVRMWLLAVLTSVWGMRLAVHIARRNFRRGSTEDPRYAAWRLEWGRNWVIRTYLQVFLLQGVLLWVVALPLQVVASAPGTPLGWLDLLGSAMVLGGLALEWTGDAHLARWLAEPAHRGLPLTTGLWAWTRHPNYFGDALVWWGIAVIALSAPLGPLGLAGALTITVLLRFVSGVPLLEARHADDPAWQEYRTRTSVFLPLPPRG